MRPRLEVLEPPLIGAIVDEAKRLLAEVGMEIRGPTLRARLLDHGLTLDANGTRVLFPPDVVDRAIASAPSSFVLFDRDGLVMPLITAKLGYSEELRAERLCRVHRST